METTTAYQGHTYDSKVVVIIPAAGLGQRMGVSTHKQYLCLDGVPILAHCLRTFAAHPAIDEIIIVTHADQLDFCRWDIIHAYDIDKVSTLARGGAQRQDSVRNGLRACQCSADDIILIHDGVRPLVEPETIDAVIAGVQEHDACIAAVPVKDTLKAVQDGKIESTPERSRMWAAQTPQGFRCNLIVNAHEQALAHGFSATDDASVLEWYGHPVAVVEGSYANLKITTPEDLTLAQAILRERNIQQEQA
ncbi:MAG: 2-C-methyl-D-erythritol 4-phosphate cytidylyltransferase [Desulfuromonadaceae bacterium]|nr:2-C-methyl-D-erythritol 4-phosphate cytidylyltransferase [Geobacteraceae bacterium]